jgi:DNA-directed RNA polymerase subunit K/omega
MSIEEDKDDIKSIDNDSIIDNKIQPELLDAEEHSSNVSEEDDFLKDDSDESYKDSDDDIEPLNILPNENIKKTSVFINQEDDDDDISDDDNDNYIQKFDESIRQKIIADYHPELKTHNYDEIEILSRVVRNNYGTIIDPLHKTIPFITKYEKARVLGERASQLNIGVKPFIDIDIDIIDSYAIALKEFEAKKIPFILKRPLPNGGVEYWKLEDLEII